MGMLVDERADVGGCHETAIVWLDGEDGSFGIQTVPFYLGFDGVPVAWEGAPFAHDSVFLRRGFVEGGHHEVEVDGEGVHGDDFRGGRPDDGGHFSSTIRGHVLVCCYWGVFELCEVAADCDGAPGFEVGVEVLAYCLGLQP